MTDLLFDVPQNLTRLQSVKAQHGIETHNSNLPAGELTWIAIHRPTVIRALKGYGVNENTSLFDMFAGYCRLLDEWKLVGYGETEADAVLDVCANLNIAVVL